MADQTVHTRARCYEVCALPPDDPYYQRFMILVEILNDGLWWARRCETSETLKDDGSWGKDDDGIMASLRRVARLELAEALAAAQAYAPSVTCGGMTPTEFAAWAEQELAEAGRG